MLLRNLHRICTNGHSKVLHKLPQRCLSSSSNLTISKDETKGVAVMKLTRKPVNSLSLPILEDIVNGIDTIEKDPACRGLIITSNLPGVFCAGLELTEMYNTSEDRLRQYWGAVQEWWLRLYGSKLVICSAINGHSPGAGCMMALCSDHRIMAKGPFSIGLNEGALGIVAPTWSYFVQAMANTIGHRGTERGVQLGHLYSGEEALAVGLVDEMVEGKDLLGKAHEQMDKWLRIPDHSRQMTKMSLRKDTLNLLLSQRDKDIEAFVKIVTQKPVQKALGHYIAKLKKTE